jgi:NTP pyrophosphatase (non-canonical NTP hydrolase)
MMIYTYKNYENEVIRLLGAHKKCREAYILGLAGESGEVLDLLKKTWAHGHPLDRQKLMLELGDTAWYVVALALQFGLTIDDVIEMPRLRPRAKVSGPQTAAVQLSRDVGRAASHVAGYWESPDAAAWKPDSAMKARLARDLRSVWSNVETLARLHQMPLVDVLQANVDKLRTRYPNGFSTEASVARVDVTKPIGAAEAINEFILLGEE